MRKQETLQDEGFIQSTKNSGTIRERQKDFTYLTDITGHAITNFERNGYNLIDYQFVGMKSEHGFISSESLNTLTHILIKLTKPL